MMVVGLTGGIGSGKTTVAKEFQKLGIPLYIADIEAKKLMQGSKIIKRKLIQLFGEEAYLEGQLNRSFLASRIFGDDALLSKMNAIVHPKVKSHFERWLKKQNAPYIIKEAAIIFENDLQAQYDYIILVTADIDERIKRLKRRDNSSEEQIKAIMSKQMDDASKIKLSDYVIENNTLEALPEQVLKIHAQLLEKAQK